MPCASGAASPPPAGSHRGRLLEKGFFLWKKRPSWLVQWCCRGTNPNPWRPLAMKLSRNQVQSKTHAVPELRFEDQKLTSFAGLFVFQLLFQRLDLKNRLRNCFHHLRSTRAYDHAMVVLGLVIHLLIGFRQLRDVRFYRDDPMVLRALGVTRLPDVATVSRLLATTDSDSVTSLRQLIRQMVLQAH